MSVRELEASASSSSLEEEEDEGGDARDVKASNQAHREYLGSPKEI